MNTPATISRLHIAHLNSALPGPEGQCKHSHQAYLTINTSEGIFLLRNEEITRCEADGNYCIVHYGSKKLLCSKTLKTIEGHLDDSAFVRVHQSHLVRITEIRLIQSDEVVLRNNNRLPLSRSQRAEVICRLNQLATKI